MESWEMRGKKVWTRRIWPKRTKEMNHLLNNDLRSFVRWAANGSFWHFGERKKKKEMKDGYLGVANTQATCFHWTGILLAGWWEQKRVHLEGIQASIGGSLDVNFHLKYYIKHAASWSASTLKWNFLHLFRTHRKPEHSDYLGCASRCSCWAYK